MAYGLVEEDAAHAGREHDGYLSRRRRDGVEHRDGALRRLLADRLRGESIEELDSRARRGTEEPRLDGSVPCGHDLRHHPDARTFLLDPAAVGGRDQPFLEGVAVHPDHLDDLGAEPAGCVVELAQPGHFVHGGELGSRPVRAVHALALAHGEVDDGAGLALLKSRARRLGRLQERIAVEAVRVRVAVRGAEGDANPRPSIEAARELFDLAVVQPDVRGRSLLDEELGEGAAPTASGRQNLLDQLAGQHGRDANSGHRRAQARRRERQEPNAATTPRRRRGVDRDGDIDARSHPGARAKKPATRRRSPIEKRETTAAPMSPPVATPSGTTRSGSSPHGTGECTDAEAGEVEREATTVRVRRRLARR